MSTITVSIDNTFMLLSILIVLTIICLRIALKNVGKWRVFYTPAGVFIAIIGIILFDLIKDTTTTWSLSLIIISRILSSIISLVGIVIAIIGIVYIFKKE